MNSDENCKIYGLHLKICDKKRENRLWVIVSLKAVEVRAWGSTNKLTHEDFPNFENYTFTISI